MSLSRKTMQELSISQIVVDETAVDDQLAYFHRREDHAQVRTGIKKVYGTGIKKSDDPGKSGNANETYVRAGLTDRVDAGMVPTIAAGFGAKITDALATLHTEPGQRFTLVHDTAKDTKEAQDLLDAHRDEGAFLSSVTKADERSVQVGSSAVMTSFSDDKLSYQALSPSDIRAYFADTIIDGDQPRAVNKKDIEDATVVVIRLDQIDVMTWSYLAIFGRSDIYPQGRHVTFRANNKTTDIPKPGDGNAQDYRIGGELANPLSYYANLHPDEKLPEYPIAVIDGGVTESSGVMPTYSSLYEDSLEMDISASHLLSTSGDAARGTTVVTRNEQAAGKPLPRTLRGQVSLEVGMGIEHVPHGASESVAALEVHTKLMVEVGAGYGVPDYMIVSEDYTVEASSGTALEAKTRSLKIKREKRVNFNRDRVTKIFDISKSLMGLFLDPSTPGLSLLVACRQTWEAGELRLPENRNETAERVVKLMDKGVYDTVAAIRIVYQLATDEEAIEEYDRMKARQSKYPPLAPTAKKNVGLLNGGQ